MSRAVVVPALALAGIVAAVHGAALAALICTLAGGLVLLARPRRAVVQGHAHAGPIPRSARHEAGHAAFARRHGRVTSAVLNSDGSGLVMAELRSDDPATAVGFFLAGQYAAGTRAGARQDERLIAAELRRVPAAQRSAVKAEGSRMARRALAASRSRQRRDAATLARRGRL